jgi:starch-binding outer membrane protein, SusD/RagB family
MKTKIKLLTGLSVLLFLGACTDDLNVELKDDNLFTAEDFYSTDASYKEGLAGVYSNLALTGSDGPGSSFIQGLDAGTSQYGRTLWYMQVLAADEAVWSYENDPGAREIQRNIWSAENPIIRGMFGRAMVQVSFANEYLRQTTEDKLNSRGVGEAVRAEIPAFRAEAKLLRALAYYHLMDLYGKAPFLTEADLPGFVAGPQYDRAQLFAFLEQDLLDIQADLKAPRSNEQGRADKAVAWMILAKMYLNAEVYIGTPKYTECITMCNNIIGGGYSLAPNYLHNFMADSNTNAARNEIIFPIISDGQYTQNYGPTTVMINGSVGSLEQNGISLGVGAGGWGGALRVRKQFADKFNDAIFDNDSRNTLIKQNRTSDIGTISDRDSGFIIAKFSNRTSTGGQGSDLTFVDTDFPLFRFADVHLMMAEAQMRSAGATNSSITQTGLASQQSVDLINQLRERAFGNQSANVSVAQVSLQFILDERLRELHWESHRRQDLIRFDRYTGGNYNWAWKGNGSNGISISNNLKVYPLPTQSLAVNPNLTQNPGY